MVFVPRAAADVPTTCYILNGKVTTGAFRCNNATTGHSSCCGAGGVCYSNGVCQESNSGVQDYLRVGCTDKTWRDPACLDQCRNFAPDSSAGIRFCNGAITTTNQYCCDNGTTGGIGSTACCDDQAQIFQINPVATLIGQIPLTAVTSTSTSSTSASSTSSTSTSSASTSITSTSTSTTPTPAASTSSSNRSAVIIGASVGVPLGVLAVVFIAFFYWRWRRNQKATAAQQIPASAAQASNGNGMTDIKYEPVMHAKHYSQQPWNERHELASTSTSNEQRVIHEMDTGESRQ
ncbi:Uncharacterized protein BP5553_05397 [Venustampulla echinocandica]|uniref:Mid2 domain-containing protein n=1 Tax=Venustampulla echinocandica TaxID=2656787 RepID=A0A370TR26_9HELO|nr:Uncharacterized protein BP5553_05397 [Venustampulla echinocandica]RDL37964.1 Uncharacterized protein BP5553_05397 [Venustampulla echinocandica]